MDIVKSSKIDNLKIMLDSFHLQRLHGNLTERVEVIKLNFKQLLKYFVVLRK